MALSDYAENKLVDHTLGTAAFTMPTQLYLALFTSDPLDDASGTEVSGNGYSRQAADFDAAVSGSADNSAQIDFVASGGNWGTITHWGLFDASTTGNLIHHGSWTASKSIDDGDTFRVAAAALTITGD